MSLFELSLYLFTVTVCVILTCYWFIQLSWPWKCSTIYAVVLLSSAARPDRGQVTVFGGAALSVDDYRCTEQHIGLSCHTHFLVAAGERGGSCEKGSGFKQVSVMILFPSAVMQETLIFDRTKWQTRLLLTKIAKQGLKSVAWYSETAVGFGWERFNWFCRLDIGLTDWLSVKITEHFSKSSLPWVQTTLAVMAGTHWIDFFCHTKSGTELASGLWE